MGCGKGGRPITFLQQIKNIPFIEAAKELGDKLGIEVQTSQRRSKFETEYEIMNRTSEFYQFALYNTTEGQKALEYLYKRGLDDDTIKHFEIGLANKEFQSLSKALISFEYKPEMLIKLGLITQSEKNQEYYDIFNNRIMFPIKDQSLNVIGFSGRDLSKSENAKYINSMETPLFKKSDVIYHLYDEEELLKEKDEVILFEGFFDVIAAYQIGYKNGIATMGTALTESQARMIRRQVKTVLIAYDGDQAGIQATHKAVPKLKAANMNVNILSIPGGLDPDDYIKKQGKKGFSELLQTNVKDSYRYYYDDLLLRLDPNNANSVQDFQQSVNILFKDANQIVKRMFEREISNKLGFPFTFSARIIDPTPLPEVKKVEQFKQTMYLKAEIDLIVELLRRRNHLELIKSKLIPNVYVLLENYQILEAIVKYYEKHDILIISDFLETIPPTLREYLDKEVKKSLHWQHGLILEEKTVKQYINLIVGYEIQREIDTLIKELPVDDPIKASKQLDRVNELKRKLSKQIKRSWYDMTYEKVLKDLIKLAGEDKILFYDDIFEYYEEDEPEFVKLLKDLEKAKIEVYEDEDEYDAVVLSQIDALDTTMNDTREPDELDLADADLEVEEIGETGLNNIMSDYTARVDDPVKMYLKDIGQIPLLTGDEEVDLAKKISAGREARSQLDYMKEEGILSHEDEQQLLHIIEIADIAKHKLVEANYRLVVHMAKKFDKGSVPFVDLIQEGNLGLMRAADKFEYERGYKFSTYATWWIRQGIARSIADTGRTIRIPVHMNETINKMGRIQRQLTQELGREPLDEEIGKEMGITADKVQYIKRISREPMSLENPVGEEEDSSLADFISDPNARNPEDYMIDEALTTALNEALETLTDREEKVLRMRYALLDGKHYTLEEVGKEFGVTRERIRQIESKALKKLRSPSRQNKLKEVYNNKRRS